MQWIATRRAIKPRRPPPGPKLGHYGIRVAGARESNFASWGVRGGGRRRGDRRVRPRRRGPRRGHAQPFARLSDGRSSRRHTPLRAGAGASAARGGGGSLHAPRLSPMRLGRSPAETAGLSRGGPAEGAGDRRGTPRFGKTDRPVAADGLGRPDRYARGVFPGRVLCVDLGLGSGVLDEIIDLLRRGRPLLIGRSGNRSKCENQFGV